MKRILLCVAYDGTSYCGWQIQPEVKTIEGVLNRELSRLLKENISVIGASRTDAGVHAEGAIAVFDTESRIPPEKFAYALNVSLPDDIRIMKSMEVPAEFHPRKVSSRKTYEYHIWNDEFPSPVSRLYTHHIYNELDITAMQAAAAAFVGEHDFAGFCSAHTQAETTVRTVYDVNVDKISDKELVISVTGNGFLYNMVRIIAGTLIDVGQGKKNPDEIPAIIAAADRNQAGPTAPAKGLRLKRYQFPDYPEIEL